MSKIQELWEKNQQIKNDINKIDTIDVKIFKDNELKKIHRLDIPWKEYYSPTFDYSGNLFLHQWVLLTRELNEPHFRNSYTVGSIPNYIFCAEEFELPFIKEMLPGVHVVPIIITSCSDEMIFDYPIWEDYWEISVDGTILWRGNLNGINISGGGGFRWFDLGWTSSFDEKYLVWRAKYIKKTFSGGNTFQFVCWDSNYEHIIHWRQNIINPEIKEIVLFPSVINSTDDGTPPEWPTPPGNTIRIKRNNPEPEFSMGRSFSYLSFTKGFAEIITDEKEKAIKHKLLLTGRILYNAPIDPIGFPIIFPSLDRYYGVEFFEEKTDEYWYRGYRYNQISSIEGTVTKVIYRPMNVGVKVKFLVDVINPADKFDKEKYAIRTK